jgi:histidine triad (HIT) family protein
VAEGCIFCAIVQGETPAHRVHKDDLTVAIMDNHPATEGHVLVIPKRHSETLWDIPTKDAWKLWRRRSRWPAWFMLL